MMASRLPEAISAADEALSSLSLSTRARASSNALSMQEHDT